MSDKRTGTERELAYDEKGAARAVEAAAERHRRSIAGLAALRELVEAAVVGEAAAVLGEGNPALAARWGQDEDLRALAALEVHNRLGR